MDITMHGIVKVETTFNEIEGKHGVVTVRMIRLTNKEGEQNEISLFGDSKEGLKIIRNKDNSL